MSTATILDVARKANVSSGTVSRVLRGHPTVSADNLRRVQQAVEALQYSPRHQKASMADAYPLERRNILMLFLGEERSVTTLPVVAAVNQGVQRAIEEAQADLTVAEVPGADHVPKVMSRKTFDGVIIKGLIFNDVNSAIHPELLERLRGIPTVWVIGRAGDWGDVVESNDILVGKIAADYLVWHGHRRLAFINPNPTHVMKRGRKAGDRSFPTEDAAVHATATGRRQASFTFFAQQAEAEVQACLGEPGKWPFPSPAVNRIEMVQGLVDKLLDQPKPPTAIFAPNDSIGVTVARALSVRGLQAGRDISLMSCNNEQALLMGIHPALTTIDIHAEEIGRRAVDQLAWRLMHRDRPRCEIAIEPTLIEGESVATL
jgi:LacI family transcriptional regulator